MLHSSFWHHGAGDLDLPAWWASVLQPSDSQPHDSAAANGRSATGQDGLFLDFLYPAKTLALMHRLSSFGWESWQARQLRVATPGRARHFSSKASGSSDEPDDLAPPSNKDPSIRYDAFGPIEDYDAGYAPDPESDDFFDDMPADDLAKSDSADYGDDLGKQSNSARYLNHLGEESDSGFYLDKLEKDKEWVHQVDNPAETLRSHLEASESDSSVVWNLWKRVDEAGRTPDLSAAVLEYLSSVRPFPQTLASEVIAIFDALDVKDRRASSYRGAIRSHLLKRKLGRAALIHKYGIESGHALRGNIGTSDLLAFAIAKKEWQLAIEAYSEITSVVKPMQEFWGQAEKNMRLSFLVESLLVHFRRMRLMTGRELEEQDQIRKFAAEFGDQAIKQFAPEARSAASGRNLYRLILRLKQNRSLESRHFEHALEGILESAKIKNTGVLSLAVRKLFHMYIATARADRSFTVSENTLYKVLVGVTRSMNVSHGTKARGRGPLLAVGHVTEAATEFCRRPSNTMLELLMESYARIGDVKRVKYHFRKIPVRQRKMFHKEYVLKAYAARGDTAGALQTFKEMTAEMDKPPLVRTWNALLRAYAKNDDLVGASQVFDDLMKSPAKPDAYSFTAILDMMSQRGDVDGVKDMFALAADIDPTIIQSTDVAGYLVTAFVNNDDMETAELVAKQLRQRLESGRMGGDFRPIWNILATAHALRRDVVSTRRIYQEMEASGTAPDARTYAALLLALCLTRNTDSAYKILQLVIPVKLTKPLALHYAIVMAGYINQGSYEKVPFVDNLRKARGIHPTTSTRMAYVKAVALSEHAGRYKKGESEVMERTNRVVNEMLWKENPWESASEPQTGLGIRNLEQAGGAYLDIVMLLQGDRKSFDTVQQLFAEYLKQRETLSKKGESIDGDKKFAPALRMLVALMNAHFKSELYDEVERLWDLAVEQATILTQAPLPQSAITPEYKYPPANALPPGRRHLLARPLVIYLRTLHFQGRYADAQRTVSGLLAQGFALDNLSWNLYVQLLARSGRISAAFSLCEKHLMPQWRGWRTDEEQLRRRYWRTRGWDYMNINPNKAKANVNMPQYRTMVFLATALKYVRRLAAIGGGNALGNKEEEPLNEGLLRENAPRTMAALQAMPMIDDDLQTRFLRDE
ncbi:Pentatricopeptide repeat-containing protein [Lasiodiplodia hormozganensis]|uniref:Pentatricopeptide repeat-containing protein n=1 Tax=Lasiodiplodia hormozganensis TaxID=869390 RepID=A0AA39TG99_9PEZI|nr:Pentatricopeptide repeat-containing protein [Lasiodiplodia hormozganensis]